MQYHLGWMFAQQPNTIHNTTFDVYWSSSMCTMYNRTGETVIEMRTMKKWDGKITYQMLCVHMFPFTTNVWCYGLRSSNIVVWHCQSPIQMQAMACIYVFMWEWLLCVSRSQCFDKSYESGNFETVFRMLTANSFIQVNFKSSWGSPTIWDEKVDLFCIHIWRPWE